MCCRLSGRLWALNNGLKIERPPCRSLPFVISGCFTNSGVPARAFSASAAREATCAGFRLSSKCSLTMADYADDANALIEARGWERCLVAGFSFGGMVAQKLALRHPHRVEPLVLDSTSSGGAGGASFPLHELTALPLEEYIRRVISLSDTRRDAAWQAVHRVANCATQEEVDRLWEKLTEGEAIEQCGWLKDKYGVSWQIVPTVLGELMSNPDPEKTNRVMQALLQMKKIDINGLKEAFERG